MAMTKPNSSQIVYGKTNVQRVLSKVPLQYSTLAEAEAAAATLPDEQKVAVDADETRDGRSTWYVVQSGALVYLGLASDAGSTSFSISPVDGAAALTVDAKLRESVSVKDFGAVGDGVTDDTVAIQKAFDYVRATQVLVEGVLRQSANLVFPPGRYLVTSTINASALRYHTWGIYGRGAAVIAKTNGKPCFDMMWSRYFKWDGLAVVGAQDQSPSHAIILGRTFIGAASDAGEYEFSHCIFYGKFTRACLYALAPEVVQYNHVKFWNTSTALDSYCLIVDTNNNENIQSDFQTITYPVNTASSCNENTYLTCDFRKDSGDTILYRGRGVARHNYINSYAAAIGGNAVVLAEASSFNLLQLDIHIENNTCKRLLYIDNETSSSNIQIKGLRLRDHQPQCTEAFIGFTGTARKVLFDECDIDVGTPANANVPIFADVGGQPANVLVTGRITFRAPMLCDISHCQFVGDLFVPDSATTIAHAAGSYRVITRMDVADNRTMKMKGAMRFIGNGDTTTGSEADSYYMEIRGGLVGAAPIMVAGGFSPDVGLRIRSKGTGAVDLQSGDGANKVRVNNTGVGFQGSNPIAKPTIAGSRGGNAALASVLTQLAAYGLITDNTTA